MKEVTYCPICDNKLTNGVLFCKKCGNKIEKQAKSKDSSRIGWSEKIHDPSFAKYNKNEIIWKLIFGLTLTVVAFFGFNIFGPKSGMEEKEAMLVGSVIGGMFFLITMGSVIVSKLRKPFSGVIIDKTCETKKKKYDVDGRTCIKEYIEYIVYYQDDITGKKKILTREEDSTFKYDYFKVGDKIKYHAIGNNGIEKYDKSEDEISYCLACNYMNDIENDKCEMCNCPIIK